MASKKNPSIFSTLQKTTANASAVNGEFTHQIPLDALEDNPLNRFSMAEDEEFLSTMHSMEKDGLLEDIIVTPSDTEGRYRIISGASTPPESWAAPPCPARSAITTVSLPSCGR